MFLADGGTLGRSPMGSTGRGECRPARATKVAGRRCSGGGRRWGDGVVASREADGDVEAPGGDGGGVHGSVVDGGDGRYQGEAETEAVVAGAAAEPGERQEQAFDHVGGGHPPGGGYAQDGGRGVGGARDPGGGARGRFRRGGVGAGG